MTSPMLDAGMLSLMRQQAQLLMPEAWTLVQPTSVSGSLGETQTWTVTASGTLAGGDGGRLMPAGPGSERLIAARVAGINTWLITLPYGTPVQLQDRVIIGTALAVGAVVAAFESYRTFEVTGSIAGHSGETVTRVAAVGV